MNFNNFTIKSQEAVQKATEIAAAKQNQAIETSHVLKGMLMVDENVIPFLLKKLNVNMDIFTPALDGIIDAYPKVSGGDTSSSPMMPQKPCRKPLHLPRNSRMNLSP
jgi:ATP-dependent Clp protease ATP-binding subunit ClpB